MKKLLFYLFPPKRIELVLRNMDFEESGSFISNTKCPLAIAFKRATGIQPSVTPDFVKFGLNTFKIEDRFNYDQYLFLTYLYKSGGVIHHKVTLI